jgi:hypothetical protein
MVFVVSADYEYRAVIHSRVQKLDWVPGGVFEQNLFATPSGDDLVAETNTRVAQRFNLANEIVDLQLNPVPPSGRWHPSVGHCLGRASSAARRINQESQVVARQDCESGSGIKTDLEVEMAGGSIRSINPC